MSISSGGRSTDEKNEAKIYWNDFYSGGAANLKKLDLPSQFALFVANEVPEGVSTIVEFGCGNGRDSRFFSSMGFRILATDASENAISSCRKRDTNPSSDYIAGDIGLSAVQAELEERIKAIEGGKTFYSRFFLHAITSDLELQLLDLLAKVCDDGELVALEFRTTRDAQLQKETASHYRRYIKPLDVAHRLSQRGLQVEYFVEGFGYAKFGADDAHVCRLIARKLR